MRKFSVYCCLVLIFSWNEVCTANPFLVAVKLGQEAISFYEGVQSIRNGLAPQEFEASSNQIYGELKGLRDDFDDLKNEIMNKISMDLRSKLTEVANTFFKYVRAIERSYEEFVDYIESPGKYKKSTIYKFARVSVSPSSEELPSILGKMHRAFIDRDIEGNNLISIIARNSTASDLMCIRHESKQQLINDLHKTFVYSSIKGLMVILYSYDVLGKLKKTEYAGEQRRAIEFFNNRTQTVFNDVKTALRMSSREVWSCDPEEYQKGFSYDKLQEVFQAYVFSEADSKRLRSYGEDFFSKVAQGIAFSTNHCSDMGDERSACHSPTCTSQPSHKRCSGHIRSCKPMPTSQICHSPDESDRRYDWLRTDVENNFAYYGRNRFYSNCANTQDITEGTAHPDHCVCNCENEHILDDRHFSLQEVLSDVDNNKVVTGVRLTKEYHVFHIQIEQGTLGPNGAIITRPEWKNVKSLSRDDLYDRAVSKPKMATHADGYEYEESVTFHKNQRVYTVKHERNSVFLDTLDAEPNRVVTGLRFQHDGESLKLEIRTAPFDYATGKLYPGASAWKSNNKSKEDRKELMLIEPDDPTKVNGPNKVISTHNQFVDFRMTDLDKDFGQYTVPFIDLQDVATTPRMPLSGAGLILRGQRGSGGFLALKVIHYDYTNNM